MTREEKGKAKSDGMEKSDNGMNMQITLKDSSQGCINLRLVSIRFGK